MKMRKMKDSGVEWIGQIPNDWHIQRIKTLANSPTSVFVDGDWINAEDISDEGIRYLTTGNVGQGIFKEQGKGYISEETFSQLSCFEVKAGDLVISRLNEPIGRACIIPKHYKRCVVAVDCVVLRPDSHFDKRFLMHTMSADRYADYGFLLARGTTMQRISRTQLGSIPLPIPPLPEQRKIAIFLDRACAKIDEIVAGTKQTIEEYKAWKASLIQEEMLKKHSFLQPLKSVVSYNDETLEDETDRDYEFDYVDIGAVKYGSGIVSRERMHFAESPSRARRIVKPGDVIVSTVRTYLRSVSIIPKFRVPLIVSTGFIVLRAKNIDSGYLQYAILSEGFISQVEANSVGISYPAINASQIVAFKIPVPRVDAQRRIADYLDKKCAAIDRVIAEKEALIADLEAYRKSLIFEVVTGKMAVA